ncbi:hypothetical protein R1sor_003574 [Riccia sorocarpa]|uniref:Protein kinase domain-containing protein n=1 Tax=Riccia sorocarpa TaxID=122646 RepID=A0ABD3H4X5_9MARC
MLAGSRQIDTSGDPCEPVPWFWVTCTGDGGYFTHISEINLGNQGLDGSFTNDLSFSSYNVFDLSNNSLHGAVPSFLGNIATFKLDLSSNNFSGPIPIFIVDPTLPESEVPSGSQIQFLNLSSNSMSGNLTDISGNFPYLKALNLSGNHFSGPVPLFYGNTTPEVIDLSSNCLSGGISELLMMINFRIKTSPGPRQSLKTLRLGDNNLSGTVPDEIWSSELQLETVDLYSNNFTAVDLTTWFQSLVAGGFSGKQKVNLLNNPIERVIIRDDIVNLKSGLESKTDVEMWNILSNSEGYIVFGGNKWCNSSDLSRARILKNYLCRPSENDDYYSVPPKGPDNTSIIIGGAVSGSVFLVIASILLIFLGRMWRRVKDLRQLQAELEKEDVRPPFYKYEELRAATKNFSDENELGRGGFGAVYKAELTDRSILAVKLLFPTEQSMTDFLKETVVITGIKHRHLIQLKGCCVRDKKRMLVYEFAENGNLVQALWGNERSFILTWAQRLKICIGVAKGLSYLHEELQPRIIHRDIKPHNILLDKDWNAKIADFGLARTMQGDEWTQATTIGGTMGYVSPEYSTEGLITEKLDVYSYGILVLEIVSGRKCLDPSASAEEFYLRNWAFKLHRESCLSSMAEKTLIESVPAQEIESLLKIALLCVQETHEKRPSMSEVVIMLTGNSSLATDIMNELCEQQQVSYDGLFETSTTNEVNGTEEKEKYVLLALTSFSHTNSRAE